MIKAYQKESPLSYTEGFFPTFEMVQNHPSDFLSVYVYHDAIEAEGTKKLISLVGEKNVIYSDKPFQILKTKENAHVIGVFRKFSSPLDPLQNHLVLVNPSDMGNLGNAMRSLLAFGYHDLAIIEPAADCFNPKTVRASMGAIFHIRIESFPSFDAYKEKYKREVYPFVLADSTPLGKVRFIAPCSLVFGNEATGLPKEIYNKNDVRIEQSDEVDSLNLTTSIAVGLYELSKQAK
ncbi:MAG: TrmH family RNA methyltransferase [Bacilli bacterium]